MGRILRATGETRGRFGEIIYLNIYSVSRLNEVQNDILIIRDYLPTPIGVECEEQEVKPGGAEKKPPPTPIGVECRLV
jgi:hypothetical protein